MGCMYIGPATRYDFECLEASQTITLTIEGVFPKSHNVASLFLMMECFHKARPHVVMKWGSFSAILSL